MAEVTWIKLSVNMFNKSRKIKRIERLTNGDTILIIWFKLMCMAGDINDGGAIYITPDVPYETEELADELRRPVEIVEIALDTFLKYDMIQRDTAGFIKLTSWEKYQNVDRLAEIREYNRLAQQKSRAKRKAQSENDTVNDKSMTSQHCHDTEEDREEDSEEDKENSFFHSGIATGENRPEFADDPASRRRYLWGIGKGVVFLSDKQMEDLLDKLSIEEFDRYVGIVADCELNGKPFTKKTHHEAILDMAIKDRKIKK